MGARFWGDLTSSGFDGLDPQSSIAVLPLAAIEQHGPHLPVSVDTTIMNAMLAEAMPRVPADLDVLVLPTQAVCKSNEHLHSPGTLTLSWETATRAWIEIGESVRRASLRKLVIVTSHGGNIDPAKVVARELRVAHGMMVVNTAWRAFGLPQGLFADLDANHGIHAGDIETSLMLHFRPDLVDMAKAAAFKPLTVDMIDDGCALPASMPWPGWRRTSTPRAQPATPAWPQPQRARRQPNSRQQDLSSCWQTSRVSRWSVCTGPERQKRRLSPHSPAHSFCAKISLY